MKLRRAGLPVAVRALLLAAGLMSAVYTAGCSKALHYGFDQGDVLVYVVSEQPGRVIEEKEEFSSPMETMEVHLRVKQKLSGRTTIQFSAIPPKGRSSAAFGRDLGELEVKIDGSAKVEDAKGMGIPQEVRFFIPELPKKLRKGEKWSEDISVRYKSNTFETKLNHEFQGVREAAGRRCYFIKGTAVFNHNETVDNRDLGVNASMEYVFEYEENYYFDIARKHIVKTEIFERRRRTIKDNSTGNLELNEVDMNRKVIELRAVEG